MSIKSFHNRNKARDKKINKHKAMQVDDSAKKLAIILKNRKEKS